MFRAAELLSVSDLLHLTLYCKLCKALLYTPLSAAVHAQHHRSPAQTSVVCLLLRL